LSDGNHCTTDRCSTRMRDRYDVLSLACASVYMCVRMFSARSVNDGDEGGNNSCEKYYYPQ